MAAEGLARRDEATYLGGLPPKLTIGDAPAEIRRRLAERGACVVAVDDDPTGNQCVRDVPVLTAWSKPELLSAARDPARLFFVLTNSRSLPEKTAAAINEEIGGRLAEVGREAGTDFLIVSRSDSTLRGHFPAETDALERGWTGAGGAPHDGVVLCPSFFEAGRIVLDGALWVRDGRDLVPAAETEYAGDPAFGYRHSELLRWAEEKMGDGSAPKSGGVGIEDIRHGGPGRVAELLEALPRGAVVAVDAAGYEDLEVFALGLLAAEDAGKRFLCRTGPSFLGAVSANRSRAPLSGGEVYEGEAPEGHGLVVVGSYTGLTTRQVQRAREELDPEYVELDTGALLDGRREGELGRARDAVEAALPSRDVLVVTGREPIAAPSAEQALAQGRRISDALVGLVGGLDPALPIRYLVAKGGITSHDLAACGLGAVRARVVGQMLVGQISVWRLDERSRRPRLPYVVFPGNVGDDGALSRVMKTLQGGS